MSLRIQLLRALYAGPRFKGRDRLISEITNTFSLKPIHLSAGILMLLDPGEWTQQLIIINGTTEPNTLNLLRRLSVKGSCVVDVGAHVGQHALVAARAVGPDGRVLAFDPQPYHSDRIARHAMLNRFSNIQTFCAAVGDRDEFITLPVQSDRDRARLSLLEAGPNDCQVSIEVPLRRLDTVFGAHGVKRVQLIKIDVEGYELEVLRGLGARIRECQNVVLEMIDTSSSLRNRQVIDLLLENGFELRDVVGRLWQFGEPLIERNLWAARN